jgi:hypothetical protein
MLRRLSPFILLVALLVAAEPLLHSHPLESSLSGASSNSACAVCATGIAKLPTTVVVIGAPQLIQHAHTVALPPVIAVDAPLPRSPRAPPAA